MQKPIPKLSLLPLLIYRIFPAIRRGFRPSRMTSNNLISPMKFCYKTNSTLPKQCQSSRSVLQDGSRTFGLFWKEKNPPYNLRNTVEHCVTTERAWRSMYTPSQHYFLVTIFFSLNSNCDLDLGPTELKHKLLQDIVTLKSV